MRRVGVLVLWFLIVLSALLTAGCGTRIAATVQANAKAGPIPKGVTWAAVPGVSGADAETLAGVEQSAVPLANVLSLYNWKWLSNPDDAADADVLVHIWWLTEGPTYVVERADPFLYGPRMSAGVGFGRSPWRRGPFGYARQGFYYPEPSVQAVYSRVFIVEALLADALPRATLEALAPGVRKAGFASAPPVRKKAEPSDLSKGPYAPPLSLDGSALGKPPYAAPLKATGADPDREPPYAPPLFGPGAEDVPSEAVLWRVVVTSGGSKANTRAILPQLAAAAAQAVGKNMQAVFFVDDELHVTYGQ